MKDILQSEPAGQSEPVESPTAKEPAPQGIGMAVAFDWGLTVQLLLLPLLSLFLGTPSNYKQFNLNPTLTTFISFAFLWSIAILFALFGEGVRRGWRWTRPVQIAGNTLGFLGGFFLLPGVWQDLKVGSYWSLVPAVILLVFSPIIAWRLSRPVTGRWFATVSSQEARKRHGGLWPWLIMIWSIVGGVLVTWGTFVK